MASWSGGREDEAATLCSVTPAKFLRLAKKYRVQPAAAYNEMGTLLEYLWTDEQDL